MQEKTEDIVAKYGTERLKRGFAQMQKGGVIMDVTTPEEAQIAEEAGAVAVMALQAVPAEIREAGGVARMADPSIMEKIMNAITIPTMAKCRIGHFAEAQVLEELGVDMIDESEVLTPADKEKHVDKKAFKVPFVCGSRDLGEALRRIDEGAAMIRTKGEAGTGNIVEAVKHIRQTLREIKELEDLPAERLEKKAEEYSVPVELVEEIADLQRLPVVWFCAGGIATPADAALAMQFGVDGVFVGSGIFKSQDPPKMARAIVEATRNYDDPKKVLEASKKLPKAMRGTDIESLKPEEKLQARGT
ncbi:pyridoxal biosynthesis protein [candidate division MSBL1 archaeon SCGC-AAA259D18]|uniref:Pyridoxal 5'-phosphate synthase subunit PdxS n=2 Tax=candidate division MSBL1 TaxID=215777 RepID=A0A133U6L8_9EURY|nr:pyridoxal biosynthesis protein [candidate division MSBL1 archaeon SCGC-AAA259A05]KXA91914.1 pyridoxal biosynthesis protein [candidate division MSBL1 archaeon SCGC-AAA259D18]